MAQSPAPKTFGTSAGVLPISATATQKSTASKASSSKAATPRLKLLVRRLPPGLTKEEFDVALGDDWKLGGGKVDWARYKEGKVSKDPAKPSKPARAYIRVTDQSLIALLSDHVRQTPFQDARNTINDPALAGPPSLEFAPYSRVPGNRVRKDGRQGTIDQDPEFIDFLESLTNPIVKPPGEDAGEDEKKEEKATTTPLIQYLKEKKANKAKEAASAAKAAKQSRAEGKDGKGEKIVPKKLLSRADKEAAQTEKQSKTDKAAKEAIKVIHKQASSAASKNSTKTAATPAKEPASAPERKRERGNISAAAKILQRDLGLAPSTARRRAAKAVATEATKEEAAKDKDNAAPPSETSKQRPSTPKATKDKNASSKTLGSAPPSEPIANRNAGKNSNPPTGPAVGAGKSTKTGKGKQANPPAAPQSAATQAFLKHANPSQGVTEPLLEAAFQPFGKVLKVEIDKKKGFGYVDFGNAAALQKAIQASPVQVAQSQVVVLERKSGSGGAPSRGSKGRGERPTSPGGKGGGGGAATASPNTNNNTTQNKNNNQGSRGGSHGPRGGRGGSKNKGGQKGGSGPAAGGEKNNALAPAPTGEVNAG